MKNFSQSVSSIKTRIKTSIFAGQWSHEHVRVYLPLKQGLRQQLVNSLPFLAVVRVYLPLKQGLRPKISFSFPCFYC